MRTEAHCSGTTNAHRICNLVNLLEEAAGKPKSISGFECTSYNRSGLNCSLQQIEECKSILFLIEIFLQKNRLCLNWESRFRGNLVIGTGVRKE